MKYQQQRKADGKAEATITNEIRTLKLLAHQANLNEPETIKTAISKAEVSNSTKMKRVKTYNSYLKYLCKKWKLKIKWEPPTYKEEKHIPFIPTEEEINTLIASCRPKLATILQLLKETAIRIGEAHKLKWTDIDLKRKVVSITPEKGSNPRILPISNKLVAMLNKYPKTRDHPLPKRLNMFRSTFDKQRTRTANKLQNPRLKKISFHTFRHWKATMEYHKTKDIIHVKAFLGHKNIETTLTYINIEQALFLNETDHWHSTVVHNQEEELKAINTGFELVRAINETTAIYKKRK